LTTATQRLLDAWTELPNVELPSTGWTATAAEVA
jgi:hypothetical protein